MDKGKDNSVIVKDLVPHTESVSVFRSVKLTLGMVSFRYVKGLPSTFVDHPSNTVMINSGSLVQRKSCFLILKVARRNKSISPGESMHNGLGLGALTKTNN